MGARTALARLCDFHHGESSRRRISLRNASRTLPLPTVRRPSLRHFQLLPPRIFVGNSTSSPHLRTDSGTGASLVRLLHSRLRDHARARPPATDRTRAQQHGSRSSDAEAERSAQGSAPSRYGILATSLLRLQRVELREACREVEIHPPQSSQERPCREARGLGVEQLSPLRHWDRWSSRDRVARGSMAKKTIDSTA